MPVVGVNVFSTSVFSRDMEKFWVLQRSRRIRANALDKEYPTAEQLLGNLPVVLRTLCDHVLTGQASTLDALLTGWRLRHIH